MNDKKRDRFRHFKSSVSPVRGTTFNTGPSNVTDDLIRARNEEITIDNIPFSDCLRPYITVSEDSVTGSQNDVLSDVDCLRFFKEVLLKNIKATVSEKDQMTGYLMANFHQGGILTAFSSAFTSMAAFKEQKEDCAFRRVESFGDFNVGVQTKSCYLVVENPQSVYYFDKTSVDQQLICVAPLKAKAIREGEKPEEGLIEERSKSIITSFMAIKPKDRLPFHEIKEIEATIIQRHYHLQPAYTVVGDGLTKQRHITTNEKGFEFQEFFQINKMMQEDIPQLIYDENAVIVEGEGTISIDFSQNPSNPTVTPLNGMISYHHPDVEKQLDKRSFLEIVLDFIKYHLGFNRIQVPEATEGKTLKDQSPKYDQLNTISDSESDSDEEDPSHAQSPFYQRR